MDDPDSVKGAWGLLKVSPPEPVCMTVRGGTGVSLRCRHTRPAVNAQQRLRGALGKPVRGRAVRGRRTRCARIGGLRKRSPLGGGGAPSCWGPNAGGGQHRSHEGLPRPSGACLSSLLPPRPLLPAAEASCPSSDILSAGLAHPPPQATLPLILLPGSPPDCSSTPRLREGPGYKSASLSGC